MKKEFKATLTEGNIAKTLLNLALPMTVGIISMVGFNLVDTYFISKLGIRELASISFTFPVIMIISSLSMGLGIGTSVLVSKSIGSNDIQKMKRYATDGIFLSFIIVLFAVIIGLFTIRGTFKLLGAEQELIPMIESYMRIWYLGLVFVVIPMVGNNVIRAYGDTKLPSLIMLSAVVVNFILDPLLIFGLGPFPQMGLKGAALATVFARAAAMLASLYVLIFKYDMLTFDRAPLKEILDSWAKVLYIGIPSAASRVILSLSTAVLTRVIALFGSAAVAAYGVSTRIEFLSITPLFALAVIMPPFIGQNIGAKKNKRAEKALKISFGFSLIWGFLSFFIIILLRKWIISIFTADPDISSGISLYLFIVIPLISFKAIMYISTFALNAMNRPYTAAALTLFQSFFILIPCIYIFSKYFGLSGVYAALALSYFFSGIFSAKIAVDNIKR